MIHLTKKQWVGIGAGGLVLGYLFWTSKKASAAPLGTTQQKQPIGGGDRQIQTQSTPPSGTAPDRETTVTLPPGGKSAVDQAYRDGQAQGYPDGFAVGSLSDEELGTDMMTAITQRKFNDRISAYFSSKSVNPSGPGSAALGDAYQSGYFSTAPQGFADARSKSSGTAKMSTDTSTPSGPSDAALSAAQSKGVADGTADARMDASDPSNPGYPHPGTPFSTPQENGVYQSAYNGAYGDTFNAAKSAAAVRGYYVGDWWKYHPVYQSAKTGSLPRWYR